MLILPCHEDRGYRLKRDWTESALVFGASVEDLAKMHFPLDT